LGVPLNGPPPPSLTNIEDDTIKTLIIMEVISEPVARLMYRTAIGRLQNGGNHEINGKG
jgi:hypothetical protein